MPHRNAQLSITPFSTTKWSHVDKSFPILRLNICPTFLWAFCLLVKYKI